MAIPCRCIQPGLAGDILNTSTPFGILTSHPHANQRISEVEFVCKCFFIREYIASAEIKEHVVMLISYKFQVLVSTEIQRTALGNSNW